MSLSAGNQAQVIGIGAFLLLGLGGGVWRTSTLRGDQNARWAARVDLAVAALDARTIRQLETLRADVDAALPKEEFDPAQAIADPAPLSQSAERAVDLHRASTHMRSALRRLLLVARLVVGGLAGLFVGVACTTLHYAELWNWSPLRIAGFAVLGASGLLLLGTCAGYFVLQEQLAGAEQLAGTAGQAAQ
jgi:hypothetical protein